ncbi:MAG: transcription repressor NadR [Clostridiales Family XIII bacterium]|nr:transcription repressor NadR [Clostridiales Family XIII bacterium]
MDSGERRKRILHTLETAAVPISASTLAAQSGVSRQVIVGDIALLRAEGADILATARGYTMMPTAKDAFRGRTASVHHSLAETREELMTIVRMGGAVLDVIVEHPFYGEITGALNLFNEEDVEEFIEHQAGLPNGLLSDITGGVHMHTLACKNKVEFDRIVAALDSLGFIVK